MGAKRIIRPYKMVDAGDMSSDVTSEVVNVEYMDNVGIQAVYSGSPVGDLKIEVSQDETNWDELTSVTVNISAAGSSTINLNQVPFAYIRVFYDSTSGSGSLTVTLTAKEI